MANCTVNVYCPSPAALALASQKVPHVNSVKIVPQQITKGNIFSLRFLLIPLFFFLLLRKSLGSHPFVMS